VKSLFSPEAGPWLLRTETPENADIRLATAIVDLEVPRQQETVPLEIADEKQYFESQLPSDANSAAKAYSLPQAKLTDGTRRMENWDPNLNMVRQTVAALTLYFAFVGLTFFP